MKSAWEQTKARSKYHFDTNKMDPRWDTVLLVKQIENTWEHIIKDQILSAKPVSWRTRGKTADILQRSNEELDSEEYDLETIGMPVDSIITNLSYDLHPELQRIADSFDLDNTMARLHVQWPGQVWNLHLDKLEKWMPEDPDRVQRYFVQLTNWEPGHFWNFGNYVWQNWRAGDAVTFDWQNVPHGTANAGQNPRVTLQVTGVK